MGSGSLLAEVLLSPLERLGERLTMISALGIAFCQWRRRRKHTLPRHFRQHKFV